MAKDNVHELRPLCPVTLILKDGSVFEWCPCFLGFVDCDRIVHLTAHGDDWVCIAGLQRTYGDGPQEAFDAMVQRARKEMHK